MISNEYLAGFIDGEGTIGIKAHKDKRIERGFTLDVYLSITNTNRAVLQLIQKQIGGVLRISTKAKGNSKDVHRLTIHKMQEIRGLLSVLTPYLIIKHEQAILMEKYCGLRLKHTNNDGYSKEEIRIAKKIITLNTRGKQGEGILGGS